MYDNNLANGVWRGGEGLQRLHGFRKPRGYLFYSLW
jgi:hypothetical protein